MNNKKVYNILASGSAGNATLLFDNKLLYDIGVPYKTIEPYIYDINYIFISHIHTDHFNISTVKKVAQIRPMITFLVGEYLYQDLINIGVPKYRINVIKHDRNYMLGNNYNLKTQPFKLYHNVDNMGLKLYYKDKDLEKEIRVIVATDTATLEHVEAKNFDFYLIEANWSEEKVQIIQDEKRENGDFDYTHASVENHLSREYTKQWFDRNNENKQGVLVEMHKSDFTY